MPKHIPRIRSGSGRVIARFRNRDRSVWVEAFDYSHMAERTRREYSRIALRNGSHGRVSIRPHSHARDTSSVGCPHTGISISKLNEKGSVSSEFEHPAKSIPSTVAVSAGISSYRIR